MKTYKKIIKRGYHRRVEYVVEREEQLGQMKI